MSPSQFLIYMIKTSFVPNSKPLITSFSAIFTCTCGTTKRAFSPFHDFFSQGKIFEQIDLQTYFLQIVINPGMAQLSNVAISLFEILKTTQVFCYHDHIKVIFPFYLLSLG